MVKHIGAPLAATALAVALAATASAAAPAVNANRLDQAPVHRTSVTQDSRDPARWQPYHQPDFAYSASEACSFGVKAHVVRDREFYKDVAFAADGTLITQLFKGPLVIRYTNTRSGASIEVNQSGHAIETYDSSGAFSSILVQHGHFGTALPAGSSLPKGLYRIGGRWSSLTLNDDGTRTVALGPHGKAENLCSALAAG